MIEIPTISYLPADDVGDSALPAGALIHAAAVHLQTARKVLLEIDRRLPQSVRFCE